MAAADAVARQLQVRLRAAAADAVECRWTDADTVLIIDNWRTLHARAAVRDPAEPRVMRRIAYHEGVIG
jgi:alpha-ketoglutarate-dependent taurine dioxygenase